MSFVRQPHSQGRIGQTGRRPAGVRKSRYGPAAVFLILRLIFTRKSNTLATNASTYLAFDELRDSVPFLIRRINNRKFYLIAYGSYGYRWPFWTSFKKDIMFLLFFLHLPPEEVRAYVRE